MNHTKSIVDYIAARIPTPESLILDVGCGPGRMKNLGKGRYVGLDNTTVFYGDKPRKVDVVGSARYLPFSNDAFDLIFTVFSMHVLPAPLLCLMDIHRVLRPGGLFLCLDYTRKTHEELGRKLYPQPDVVSYNFFDGRMLVDLCRAARFRTIRLGRFLPRFGLRLPVPGFFRPYLVPLLDRQRGCWLVEATK